MGIICKRNGIHLCQRLYFTSKHKIIYLLHYFSPSIDQYLRSDIQNKKAMQTEPRVNLIPNLLNVSFALEIITAGSHLITKLLGITETVLYVINKRGYMRSSQ